MRRREGMVALAVGWTAFFAPVSGVDAALPPEAYELRNLGLAQLENERPGDAEATYHELIQAAPREPLGHANLAIALLRQQKFDQALGAIDQALRVAPARADLV
ncbi:MAG TPA: tetratricopeptide repeat protein, partial [Thermoanaerobaculia bacterium]|nr:tetratricopeptide repeat protein [Thermoanaerobaculia bacterium]